MLNNITLCEYISFYVFSRQMLGIWIVSAFWVLWIMLLWTFVFKFLCGHVFISLGNMARSRIDGSDGDYWGFPGGARDIEPACQCRRSKRRTFNPWVRRSPGREHGSPLHSSCLENPMDMGLGRLQGLVMDRKAWRAAVHESQRVGHNWVTELNWTEVYKSGEETSCQYRGHERLRFNPWFWKIPCKRA